MNSIVCARCGAGPYTKKDWANHLALHKEMDEQTEQQSPGAKDILQKWIRLMEAQDAQVQAK